MTDLTRQQRRSILIAMCLALGAVVGSASGLNLTQQELALDLNASQSDVRSPRTCCGAPSRRCS